jgi:hypothetical protein
MRTYVDITFSSEGRPATSVAERLLDRAGLALITGPHDLCFEWSSVEEFQRCVEAIHAALEGTHATYRLETLDDEDDSPEPVSWPPGLRESPRKNPGYSGKNGGP